jgi:hypothetical protein
MKRFVIITVCVSLMLVLAGCYGPGRADSNELWDGTPPAQDAIPDFFEPNALTAWFPEEVVGVWEAQLPDIKWDIKIEPDGSIKRVVHYVAGAVKMEEGGVSEEGRDNSSYVFLMGPCEARYIPQSRMLQVKIVVDYFLMQIPAGEIEGRMEDYFEGFVDEDGKMWNTQWFSFKWIKGVELPNIKWRKANPEPLIFVKYNPVEPRKEQPLDDFNGF